MKKLTIILALMLAVFNLCSCGEDAAFPYIPFEKDEPKIPATGEDAEEEEINYKLGKVLLCDPVNHAGVDILKKLDFFGGVKMTVIQSPTGMRASIEKGDVPFNAWGTEIPAGEFECELDMDVVPNQLRIKGTDTVIATFESTGFTVSFQLDSDQLTYKYIFERI